MQITLYRHAEPQVSADKKISGTEFASCVHRYNASDIKQFDWSDDKLSRIFSSNLLRSYQTAKNIGKEVKQNAIYREAEIPLLSFPSIKLPAKYWLFLARLLWFFGNQKNCESFSDTRQRAKDIVDKFEIILKESGSIALVGHGLMNRFIEKELIKRNWLIEDKHRKNKYLGKVILSK